MDKRKAVEEIIDRIQEIDRGEVVVVMNAITTRLAELGYEESVPSALRDRLLDVHQAAEKLGCSTDHLYHNSTNLPFVVRGVGRRLKFSESGIEKWIRSRSGR